MKDAEKIGMVETIIILNGLGARSTDTAADWDTIEKSARKRRYQHFDQVSLERIIDRGFAREGDPGLYFLTLKGVSTAKALTTIGHPVTTTPNPKGIA